MKKETKEVEFEVPPPLAAAILIAAALERGGYTSEEIKRVAEALADIADRSK